MELKLISKTDNSIEIEFAGETDTLLNLLKQELLANDKVTMATYVLGHPSLDEPRLFVEVTDGKPEQHVKAAAKAVRAKLDDFETQLLKATA